MQQIKSRRHSRQDDDEATQSECEALVIGHALSITSKEMWTINSGATCHMCNDESFSELNVLKKPQEVSVGAGHVLEATAKGTVPLQVLLPDGSTQNSSLKNVLLIPKLAYNLHSVSKASEAGKMIEVSESRCEILNASGKCITYATKMGSLYYLRFAEISNE